MADYQAHADHICQSLGVDPMTARLSGLATYLETYVAGELRAKVSEALKALGSAPDAGGVLAAVLILNRAVAANPGSAPYIVTSGIAACMRLYAKLTERVAELMEALAPFANRCAEKAQGGKYSALTDSQWRRALETYQVCPGGDMCGCGKYDEVRDSEELDDGC